MRRARFQWMKNIGSYNICYENIENMIPGNYFALDDLINYIERNPRLNLSVDSEEISEAETFISLLFVRQTMA